MGDAPLDTLVIGAGQAGLAMSRCLQRRGIPHAVLERGRVGETWRTQRWDSFHLNTPNRFNVLPDQEYGGGDALGFSTHGRLLESFEEYARHHDLPVEEGVEVTAVRRTGGGFEVEAGNAVRRCRQVVLCSGDQNAPVRPSAASRVPDRVAGLHAAEYRSAGRLPPGAVLVVGSGQSGVQIAEDLLEAGRTVWLSTSLVGRAPRRYRGRDVVEWLELTRMGDQRPEDLEDPNEVHARQVQISGTHGGHSVSLHRLARNGARLLGRFRDAEGSRLLFDGDLRANVARGDEAARKLTGRIDEFIRRAGIDAPEAEPDEADVPFEGIAGMAAVRELDADDTGLGAVIWATGYRPRFGYLAPELVDDAGRPRHVGGVGEVPGLYCVGFVWLRRRFSGLIAGVGGDAEVVADRIAGRRSG